MLRSQGYRCIWSIIKLITCIGWINASMSVYMGIVREVMAIVYSHSLMVVCLTATRNDEATPAILIPR